MFDHIKESNSIIHYIKGIWKIIARKSWNYNLTEMQQWWADTVRDDMRKKGFDIDDQGHTYRIGDGEP